MKDAESIFSTQGSLIIWAETEPKTKFIVQIEQISEGQMFGEPVVEGKALFQGQTEERPVRFSVFKSMQTQFENLNVVVGDTVAIVFMGLKTFKNTSYYSSYVKKLN